MRLFFILAVIGISSCAKLDLKFLASSNEKSSGVAVDFFIEPEFDATGFDENSFGFVDSIDENKKELTQKSETPTQKENDIPQETNGFYQNHNSFSQNQNSDTMYNLPQPDNADPQYVDTIDRTENVKRPEDPKSDHAQAAFEKLARILRLDTENNGEVYSYSYKSDHGHSSSAQGVNNNGADVKGGLSYTGDDGKVYNIRFDNEITPRGDLLAPPALLREIRKAILQNDPNETNGFYDDGVIYTTKYHPGKYANGDLEAAHFNNFAYGNDMFGIGNNGNGFGDANYNFNGFNPESDETEGSAIAKKTNVPTSFDQNDEDWSSIISNTAHHFPSNIQKVQIKNQRPHDRNGNKNYGAGDETIPLIKSLLPSLENQRFAIRNRRPNPNRSDNLDIKENLYSINNEYFTQNENQQMFPRNQVNIKSKYENNNQNINENISPEEDLESINNLYFQTHESQEFGNQRTKIKNFGSKDNSVLTNNLYIPLVENSGLSTKNRKPINQNVNKEDVACVKKDYLPPFISQKPAPSYQRQERIHQPLNKIVSFDQEPESFLPLRDRSRGNLRFNKDGGPQVASNPGFRSDPALNFGGRSARKSKITEVITTTEHEQPEQYEDNDYDSSEF